MRKLRDLTEAEMKEVLDAVDTHRELKDTLLCLAAGLIEWGAKSSEDRQDPETSNVCAMSMLHVLDIADRLEIHQLLMTPNDKVRRNILECIVTIDET